MIDCDGEGLDGLREEIEQMFDEEARKASQAAKPKPKFPPGYYDEKKYREEER